MLPEQSDTPMMALVHAAGKRAHNDHREQAHNVAIQDQVERRGNIKART